MDMIYWDHYYNLIILLNLVIVVGLFMALRLFSGMISHIHARDELVRKDNPAFGVSLAAVTFGVTVMLSGTFYGSPENDRLYAMMTVGVFGLTGIVLMALTRLIFGHVTLPKVALRDEIVAGNMAVAIADAGNVLAAAVILRAVMIWVSPGTLQGWGYLLAGYAISQALLTLMTVLRIRYFSFRYKTHDLQTELRDGNTALALRFAGQKIGAAFAMATAAQIVVYEQYDLFPILGAWLAASIAVIVVWKILSYAAQRIILFGINAPHEVVIQRNVAIGAFQAVIYIAIGLLLSQL